MRARMMTLKAVGCVWCTLVALVIVISIIGVWMSEGFSGVQRVMSPFDVWNFVAMAVIMAPGAAALYWADRIKERLRYER